VGGLIGGVVAVALVGVRRLALTFGVALVFWGAPILFVGLWADAAPALVLIGLAGLALTLVDVAGFTLLQRAVPDEVLARAMAVMESMFVATIGLGAILAPLAISGLGIRGALVATGALLPVLAALTWTRLVQIDDAAVAPEEQLALLRGIPIFAPLPATTLEQLATSLSPVRFTAGTPIFHQGDAGDRFYVIKAGEVEISVDGASPKVESAGDYFGEIALLRNVPRTASVTARTDVELYALERDEFIGAVTGHARSADAADAVIGARLGALRPGVASV
jgi:hypothetical protein